MSDEINIQMGITIQKGYLFDQPQPTNCQDDMTGTPNGPSPGTVTISTTGTDIDFSQLVAPGWVRFLNLDSTNYVTWGVWDPELTRFYPVGRIKPGKPAMFFLAPELSQEMGAGSGTGTVGPSTNTIRMKANAAPCNVLIQAYES